MSPEVGIVCGSCDWFNPEDGTSCAQCGYELSLIPASVPVEERETGSELLAVDSLDETVLGDDDLVVIDSFPPVDTVRPTATDIDERLVAAAEAEGVALGRCLMLGSAGEEYLSKERQMQQARHYVCKSCYSPIPGGHKFCGKCGAPTNFAEDYGSTQYFGAMQVPNKAKLILIKGEGLDGISYHLNSTEHVAGRQQGAILFPDDAWLSPRHANFFYRESKLFVRDEESVNGVFVRTSEPVTLKSGQKFMCGEQLFKVETAAPLADGPEADGTYFFASPTKSWSFRIVQLLPGGIEGMVIHDDGGKLVIGREECNMNFLDDRFMSPKHAEIEAGEGGEFTLTDLESQNGSFMQIDQEHELVHGDYIFLGKQLLRVEVTP